VSARYSATAIALHWLVAGLLFGQLALGWWMIDLPKSPPGLRAGWFNIHKSIGLTIGLLMLARLWWRTRHLPPALPASLPRWQALCARANHAALYACLLLMPLSGYLGSVFSGYPIKYFGMALPQWGWASPVLKEFCSGVHLATVYVLMALAALHIAAALKHLVVKRDGVFARMWPVRARAA
jgi:cytochrome b561